MAFNLAVDFIGIGLAAWFWPHCAKPALTAKGASPAAHWLVLGITVLMVAAFALTAVLYVVHVGRPVAFWTLWVVGPLWILVVGLGYWQDYALLRRVTRNWAK